MGRSNDYDAERKIFKTFIVTIREINKHGGPEKFFREYPVGGMYYGEQSILRDENGTEIGTQFSFETLNECKKHSPRKLFMATPILPGIISRKIPPISK